jgi:hypothetical protein
MWNGDEPAELPKMAEYKRQRSSPSTRERKEECGNSSCSAVKALIEAYTFRCNWNLRSPPGYIPSLFDRHTLWLDRVVGIRVDIDPWRSTVSS